MYATTIQTLRFFANLLAVAFCLAVIVGLSSGNVVAPIAENTMDTDQQMHFSATDSAQTTIQSR